MIDPLVVPQASREFGGIKHMQVIESVILHYERQEMNTDKCKLHHEQDPR